MFRLLMSLAVAGVLLMAWPTRAAPPPVEDYGKLPAVSFASLSPSGERYAYVADDGKTRRLMIKTADDQLVAFLDVGAKKVRAIDWAGEDYVIVYRSNTDFIGDKVELWSAVVLNLKTRKQLLVFAGRQDVQPPIFGYYGSAQINGHWYGYFGGETMKPDLVTSHNWFFANKYTENGTEYIAPDLYRVDLESGALQIVAIGQPHSDSWLVEPNGEVRARALYDDKTGDWSVWTGGRDGRELTSGRSKLGDAELMSLGRDGDSVLIRYADDHDAEIIEDLPLSGAAAKAVNEDGWTEGPLVDKVTRRWIGVFKDGDEPAYSLFSPSYDAVVRATRKAFPGYIAYLESWNADFSRLIVFTDGGDDAGTYWIVDVAKKSAHPFGEAYPTVTPADVGPTRMVDWTAADGLALRGVLTLPPGGSAKNLPLVVMPHGGPQDRDYPGFDYWAQAFASRGYAVFQPNFRGSDGYGAKLRDAGFGEWGRKMQTDISDGVTELARQGIVDPKRACIVGASYGGYAALAGVTIQHGLYRCAVSMAGISDLRRMTLHVRDETGYENAATRYWDAFLGAPIGSSALDAISPAKLADHANAPILLIHGKDDSVVPILQSDLMEQALKAAGKPVERVTLTGADHWLLEPDARLEMLKASVAFVEKYNPADPVAQSAPTPAR